MSYRCRAEFDDLSEQFLVMSQHRPQGFEITRAGGFDVECALVSRANAG